MKNNLKELRIQAKLTQEQLGARCYPVMPGVYISRYESGKVSMTRDVIDTLCGVLNVTPSILLGYEQPTDNRPRTVPIVGYVGAGAEVFPHDDHCKGEGMAEIECPNNIDPDKGLAVQVCGDSMEPLISEGDIMFYEGRLPGVPSEYLNKRCIVWLEDGRCLIKKVAKGTSAGLFNLQSLNPSEKLIENALVQYSAFVKTWIQR